MKPVRPTDQDEPQAVKFRFATLRAKFSQTEEKQSKPKIKTRPTFRSVSDEIAKIERGDGSGTKRKKRVSSLAARFEALSSEPIVTTNPRQERPIKTVPLSQECITSVPDSQEQGSLLEQSLTQDTELESPKTSQIPPLETFSGSLGNEKALHHSPQEEKCDSPWSDMPPLELVTDDYDKGQEVASPSVSDILRSFTNRAGDAARQESEREAKVNGEMLQRKKRAEERESRKHMDEIFLQKVMLDLQQTKHTKRKWSFQDDFSTADYPTIVIDQGADTFKVGLAGHHKEPYEVIHLKSHKTPFPITTNDTGPYNIDWDALVDVWEHIFNDKLRVNPEEHAILLTQNALASKIEAERSLQSMFEYHNPDSVCIQNQSVLSMLASGKLTGLSMSCGHGIIEVVPMFEGYAVSSAVETSRTAGFRLTDFAIADLYPEHHLTTGSGMSFSNTSFQDEFRHIKEERCYVSSDFPRDLLNSNGSHYRLPDGQCLSMEQKELCLTGEILFGRANVVNVVELIQSSIQKCDLDLMLSDPSGALSLVLSGGTSLYKGFVVRLEKELKDCEDLSMSLSVTHAENRLYSAYVGGCMASSTKLGKNRFVSKQEYDECGPVIVYRKCMT